MSKNNQETKIQTLACSWQLVPPENTIVTDNEQGNIVFGDGSNNFSGGPFIVLKVSENETTVEASGYFE